MLSAFRLGPATSGCRLCDIDRVLIRVTCKDHLSISHSPRPLVAGPKRNAKNTESLLTMPHRLWAIVYGLSLIHI